MKVKCSLCGKSRKGGMMKFLYDKPFKTVTTVYTCVHCLNEMVLTRYLANINAYATLEPEKWQ